MKGLLSIGRRLPEQSTLHGFSSIIKQTWTNLIIADGLLFTSQVLGILSALDFLILNSDTLVVSAGQDEIVQELIGAGADVNRCGILPAEVYYALNVRTGKMTKGSPHCESRYSWSIFHSERRGPTVLKTLRRVKISNRCTLSRCKYHLQPF